MQSIHSGIGGLCWAWPLSFCWFCVCLLSDETQIWLGDLRVVVCRRLLVFVCFGFFRFVDGCRYIATVLCTLLAFTSRTAQGGGGSFKNRKPIGEVRGRQSGIPERSHCWTDRRLISVSLFL